MKEEKLRGKTILPLVLVLLFLLTLPIAFAPFNNCPGDTVNGWWDISNTQTVNTTANIICEYINISNGGRLYVNSSMGNHTVNITVGNLTIQAGGEINGTGTGFLNGSGEGRGTGPSNNGGGGGGHGGQGGRPSAGTGVGGNFYGNALEPRTLGSSGGPGLISGAAGGGAVLINVSNITWVNGTIAINGEPMKTGATQGGGGGAGGSLFLDTDQLYGTGTLQARGGQGRDVVNDGGSGGGGRIAVYYKATGQGFSFNNTNVGSLDPPGSGATGDPGTAVFVHKDNKNLDIVGGFDFTLATYNFSNVTIEHAFLRANQTFELNATGFVNKGGRATNMSCYNTTHAVTFRFLRDVGLDNMNITDKGRDSSECGNITIHRLETRTNMTINNLYLLSNKTLIFNVTSDDLILNATQLIGNLNITNLTNLSIYSTSFLNASARGNPNGTFEGRGAVGSSGNPGGGGAYGGRGGVAPAGSAVGGNQYGDPFAPSLFGSPGGSGSTTSNRPGSAGGGIIYLNVSNTFWNNGTIVADGEDTYTLASTDQGGAGSGGSIWIDTTNYYGTGSLFARGGTSRDTTDDNGAGGGGRIAVYYNNSNNEVSFNATSVRSRGALSASLGDPGTALFIDKDDKNLYIVGGFDFTLATYNFSNVTIEHAFLRANQTFEFNATGFVNTGGRATNLTCYNTSYDFTIRSLRVLGFDNMNISDQGDSFSECGNITIHRLETRTNMTINNLYLLSNKTLIFNVTSDDLILNATQLIGNLNITNLTNMSIYSTSIINATGRGNKNGTFEGVGTSGSSANPGGGGGYGGVGGNAPTGGASGGTIFGDAFNPRFFGSPGGSGTAGSNRPGSAGGGIIYLNVSNTFWNNGTIVVDGEDTDTLASTDQGGAGSGGSIWIDTTNYYGTGTLFARGGTGRDTTDDNGAGGGGRIAVYYNTTNSEVSFNTTSVRARDAQATGLGDPGTALFIDKNDNNLYVVEGIDFTLATYNYSNVTIEHAYLRVNRTFELNATYVSNTGSRISNMTCYNTSHGITFKVLRDIGLENFNLSDRGATFNECGNVSIHRVETRTNYTVSTLTLESNGTLQFNVTGDDLVLSRTILSGNMNFTVTNFTINGTSSLLANFRGNWNGTGAGAGGSNDSATARGGGGGGYGGSGGHGQTAGGVGGVAHGSNVTPNALGSGGGGATTAGGLGGNGGGFIFINATNKFELNGTINASGQDGATTSSRGGGGGSGGSIWIWTRILNGTGILSVHGGDGGLTTTDGGGGGGGRIAVYFRNDQTNGFTRDRNGGEGQSAVDGAAGTIEFLQTNDTTNPAITVLRPAANTAVAVNGRVNMSMTATDNDEINIVLINITYPDNTTKIQLNISNFTQVGSIYNHSFADTNQAGTYNITFFANDTTGNRNETEKTNFTVDNILPTVATIRPTVNSAFNASNQVVNISATVTDNLGVDVVLANITYPDNSTKEQLRLVNISNANPAIFNFSFGNTSNQGHYNVTFIANDTVNNINSTEKTNFTIDRTAPSVTTLRPAANTVFDNASIINISATAVDGLLAVDTVLVNITYPDNTSKEQFTLVRVGNIFNVSINITNQSGTYNLTFIANDTVGNVNGTEKTNFTMNATVISNIIDIANTTNITFMPDPIKQNDLVSFNATFNVTGNINATGLNVTLTVDNVFITSTSFNLQNGTTRVVELNWTAENGTHAIRLNADANNTFTAETFENNNNATATITVFNVSVLNFSSPANNTEVIRGLDTSSLPGEDTLKKVSNLTTISARVYNRYAPSVGVNSNCTFYFNTTVFLGWNQTNTTGECTFTFDHTIYATAVYNITVNYTNLNTTNYLKDTGVLVQNTSRVDLGKVEVDLNADNQRTGSVYNPGDVAVMNITVTKNSTAFDPNRFTVEVKNPGTECNSNGGILFNHSYPGDIVRLSTGLFQTYSILEVDTDIHWCVVVNNSAAAPLGSASHSDKEVTNTNANRANFTMINTTDTGDDVVFDDINITLFSSRGNYKVFDRNFSIADGGENRVLTLNERYNVLFRHPVRQEQVNVTGLNITAGNRSLPFNLLPTYSGRLPSNFTNITTIIAFNNSGFSFTSANVTIQKANLTINKIVHCLNWNFSSGNCIGNWEINQTSDYANFGQNATHMWFQVAGFTAYGGGNGSNANLTIYDQNDTEGGSLKAEIGANINFTANYTRLADRSAITGATCNVSFSTAPAGPSAMTYDSTKQIYNFTRTFSSDGNFTWNVTCGGSGFDTTNASDTIELVDTTGPTVSSITPIVATSEARVTFSATVTDSGTVSGCNLFVGGVNDGAMTISGSTASRAVLQSHPRVTIVEMYANCTDTAGNRNFTRTNISVEPLQSGGGNPGGGTRAGGESSAATADGLEGGTRYEAGKQGDIFSIDEHGVQSYVHVVAVLPNAVRLDVGGLYNIVLSQDFFRRFDLNRNGIMETTIYIDEIVSYSKVDFSILVEDDGGAPVTVAPQNFFTLAEIWEKVETEEEEQEKEETADGQEQLPKQDQEYSEEQREDIPILQTPSVWMKILNGIVQAARTVQNEASITGGAVVTETNTFVSSTVLKSTATKITAILVVTVGLLGSGVVSTYVSGKRCKKREEELDAVLEKEMQYNGLR